MLTPTFPSSPFCSIFIVLFHLHSLSLSPSLQLQSVGYLLGAVLMATDKALIVGIVIMLAFMLIGGFFAPTLPYWVRPLSYLSPITYSYDAILQLNFGFGVQLL